MSPNTWVAAGTAIGAIISVIVLIYGSGRQFQSIQDSQKDLRSDMQEVKEELKSIHREYASLDDIASTKELMEANLSSINTRFTSVEALLQELRSKQLEIVRQLGVKKPGVRDS